MVFAVAALKAIVVQETSLFLGEGPRIAKLGQLVRVGSGVIAERGKALHKGISLKCGVIGCCGVAAFNHHHTVSLIIPFGQAPTDPY